MKFGTDVYLVDIWVDLEGQGHMSKVKFMCYQFQT